MKTASKSGTVQVNINTYDKGDDTIVFRSLDTGKVWVKERGKETREIDVEIAVAWMTKLYIDGYGVTTERKAMPAWAV